MFQAFCHIRNSTLYRQENFLTVHLDELQQFLLERPSLCKQRLDLLCRHAGILLPDEEEVIPRRCDTQPRGRRVDQIEQPLPLGRPPDVLQALCPNHGFQLVRKEESPARLVGQSVARVHDAGRVDGGDERQVRDVQHPRVLLVGPVVTDESALGRLIPQLQPDQIDGRPSAILTQVHIAWNHRVPGISVVVIEADHLFQMLVEDVEMRPHVEVSRRAARHARWRRADAREPWRGGEADKQSHVEPQRFGGDVELHHHPACHAPGDQDECAIPVAFPVHDLPSGGRRLQPPVGDSKVRACQGHDSVLRLQRVRQ